MLFYKLAFRFLMICAFQAPRTQVKRRCSVTKYNLTSAPAAPEQAPEVSKPAEIDDNKTAETSCGSSTDGIADEQGAAENNDNGGKKGKKGVLKKIRKRLSIAF